jgi:DNA-binding PadR family transcriptional regulator
MFVMVNKEQIADFQEKLTQELRRGVLILATLSQLDSEQYGYSLIQRLSDLGLTVDQGTLYPQLRRLEEQGLLESNWNVDGPRPRRYYVLSPAGRQVLERVTADWHDLVRTMAAVLAADINPKESNND